MKSCTDRITLSPEARLHGDSSETFFDEVKHRFSEKSLFTCRKQDVSWTASQGNLQDLTLQYVWVSYPQLHVIQATVYHVQCFVYGTGTSSNEDHPSCTVAEKLFAHPVYVCTSTLIVDTTTFVLIPIIIQTFLFIFKIRFNAVSSFQHVKI
jgi:hypothetical protein